MARSRSSLARPLAVGALVCLVALAGVVVRRSAARAARAEAAWTELTSRVAALRDELANDPTMNCVIAGVSEEPGSRRPVERSVLHGEARDGRAFEHYLRAAEMLEHDEEAGNKAPRVHQVLGVSDEKRDAYLAQRDAYAPVLRELALGARSRDASLAVDWSGSGHEWDFGIDAESLGWMPARRLSRMAFSVALTELAWGDPEVALGHLLDALQLARDLCSTSLLADSATGADLLAPGWVRMFAEDGGFALFDADQRARWIDALTTVDDALITFDRAIEAEVVLTVGALERHLEALAAGKARSPVSSTRLMENGATYYGMHLDFEKDYRAAFASEPVRRPHRVFREYERAAAEADFYLSHPLTEFRDATTQRLWGLAELRLLRVALARRAGREGLPAKDRLGLPILTEVDEGRERFYLDTGPQPFGLSLEVVLPAR